jgi:hypothetical protein
MTRPMVGIPLCAYGLLSLQVFIATAWLACNGHNPAGPVQGCRLTVIAGAGGEIIAPAQSVIEVSKGASAMVSARPQRGYTFARWTVFGDSATVVYQNAAAAEVTLIGDDTVRAEFLAVPALPGTMDLSSIPTENGVNFLSYTGSWTELPDFPALAPDTAGPVDTLSVATVPHGAQNFGAMLSGYLSIPLDGSYTFYLASSDGSALYLNDSLVLSNDGVHSIPAEDSVTVALTHGFYLIGVRYFDAASTPFLSVGYACPDIGIDKMTIPKDALYRADTRPAVRITVTQPAGGETFRLGDTIHVRWNYKNSRGQVYALISVDNGKHFDNISINAFPGNVTAYDWQIPLGADSLMTQTAFIRVEEYPPFTEKGVSKAFSIVGR